MLDKQPGLQTAVPAASSVAPHQTAWKAPWRYLGGIRIPPAHVALWLLPSSCLLLFLIVNILAIYCTGPYGWDDGAITLAYARTLARHGVVAVTGLSDVAEGTSSLLYMLLLAGLHLLSSPDFYGFILISQVVSLLAVCALAVLLFCRVKSSLAHAPLRLLVVVLLVSLPMFTAEVQNGMEMTVFALLLTGLTILYEKRSSYIYWVIPLVLLTRFESVFYLAFALAVLFLLNQGDRRRLLHLGLFVLISFGLCTAFRLAYFGDFIPNTIRAKAHEPYSRYGSLEWAIVLKVRGLETFVTVNQAFIVAFLGLLLWQKKLAILNDIKFILIVAFALFSLLTGRSAGYDGRMFLPCLPLFLLLLNDAFAIKRRTPSGAEPRPTSNPSLIMRKGAWEVAMVLGLLWAHWGNYDIHQRNLQTAINGGFYQRKLSSFIERRWPDRLPDDSVWFGITPANYRETGLAVQRAQALLGLATIKFMTPDVGGLGLCCDDIRVIDSALLTNSILAKRGYGYFEQMLREEAPDVLETHGQWSEYTRIFESAYFMNHYLPIVFDNNVLWFRQDRANALLSLRNVFHSELDPSQLTSLVRYGERRNNEGTVRGDFRGVKVAAIRCTM